MKTKSLTRFWSWFQTKILGRSDIYFGADLYMRRWRFFSFRRLPGIRLHQILRSDLDREFHDHPFWFVSFILKGGYWEFRPGEMIPHFYPPGSIIFRRATDLHRLELTEPAWTFVIRGPISRPWGFMTDHGWVDWKSFTAVREGQVENLGKPGTFASSSSLGHERSKS